MSKVATQAYQDAASELARQELVLGNLSFVRHVLGKLVGRLPSNADIDNLESAGVLGLVEASHQFDPNRGVGFRTFAYPRVWGAIIDEMRRNSPLPQKLMNQITKVKKAQETLEPPLTPERLSTECHLTIEEVENCLIAMRISSPSPLSDKTFDDVSRSGEESVSAGLEFEDAKSILADCIERLPEQQRLALTMYYSEDLRLKEIGSVMKLSESRVSKILTQAELAVRDSLRES